MIAAIPLARLFRRRGEGGDRVAFIELFFDLVFVLAVTQLSHHVVDHLDPRGLLEGLVMLVAIWWVWMYTTWVTNWMDPQRGPVPLALTWITNGVLAIVTAVDEITWRADERAEGLREDDEVVLSVEEGAGPQ